MSERVKKIITIVQWIVIVILLGTCVYMFFNDRKDSTKQETIVQTDNTYVKTYESQKLKELEKENKALYDSIKNLSNLESAVEIKYVYRFKTDTVYVSSIDAGNDSVYKYTYDNDTLRYDLAIKAKELKWHKTNFELNDKFTIVNTENNGNVTTIIGHSPNAEIEDVTTWHNKKKFWDNVYYGPSISVGYGVFNKKPDIFVGFSIGWNFNK